MMITAIKEKLQKSLVLMGEIGGNDFNGPFSQRKPISEVSALIPKVVNTIKDAILVSSIQSYIFNFCF